MKNVVTSIFTFDSSTRRTVDMLSSKRPKVYRAVRLEHATYRRYEVAAVYRAREVPLYWNTGDRLRLPIPHNASVYPYRMARRFGRTALAGAEWQARTLARAASTFNYLLNGCDTVVYNSRITRELWITHWWVTIYPLCSREPMLCYDKIALKYTNLHSPNHH